MKIRKVSIGERNQESPEKVVMLFGVTGSGKSTLINAMFNYIVGIKWEDNFRLKLICKETPLSQNSQTDYITAYVIYHNTHANVGFTITIIDTPGFEDTTGIQSDQEIMTQIKTLFTTQGPGGVDSLNAVGFVTQSALPRLTPSQRYIFDSILSLFGKDIGDNIIMLLTFADEQPPQVLAAIKEVQIPYKKHFKFNNSALYVSNKGGMEGNEFSEDENFDEMFWKMGKKSFKTFMAELDKLQKKSLVLTQDILEERSRLEISVEAIKTDVKMELNKLEQLSLQHSYLKSHQSDIAMNPTRIKTCQEEFEEVQLRVLQMVDQARQSIEQLNQIALKTNTLSTADYIDILITNEKYEAKPGWKERMNQLCAVKKKAKQKQQIVSAGLRPICGTEAEVCKPTENNNKQKKLPTEPLIPFQIIEEKTEMQFGQRLQLQKFPPSPCFAKVSL